MWEKVKHVFIGKYLGTAVRTTLTFLGGYLVSRGLATPEDVAQTADGVSNIVVQVAGALLAGVGLLSSVVGAVKGTK